MINNRKKCLFMAGALVSDRTTKLSAHSIERIWHQEMSHEFQADERAFLNTSRDAGQKGKILPI